MIDKSEWMIQYENLKQYEKEHQLEEEINELDQYQVEYQKTLLESQKVRIIEKCDIHPKGISKNCRKCKKISEENQDIQDNQESKKDDYQLLELPRFGNDNIHKIWGESTTCNINPRLKNNILHCNYFKKLYAFKTFNEVIDEIQKSCSHAEPWAIGGNGVPSTLFCCLYKYMLMKLTNKQIKYLIEFKLSPYVRCTGLLYIRYVSDPEYIWSWMRKYLVDDEEFAAPADGSLITIGEYVERLLLNQDYFNTRLPRIPIKLEIKMKAKLIMIQEKRERKKFNLENVNLIVENTPCRAISKFDEEWHDGLIKQIEGKKVRVLFSKDELQQEGEGVFQGGEEHVNLGELEIIQDKAHQKKVLKDFKLYSSSPEPTKKDSFENSSDSDSDKRRKSKKDGKDKDRKHKKDKKKHKYRHRSKRSYSRSRSSSRSERRSRQRSELRRSRSRSIRRSRSRSKSLKKKHQTMKEREERLINEIKQEHRNKAQAFERKDVAKLPNTYKYAISSKIPSTTQLKIDTTYYPETEKIEKLVIKELSSNVQKQIQTKSLTYEQMKQKEILNQKYGNVVTKKKEFGDYE